MSFDLNKLIDLYGFKGVLMSLVIMGIGYIIRSNWWNSLWNKTSDKFIEWVLHRKSGTDELKEITESDIINHDIFNYIDFWVYSKIPTFQFYTDYRTIVFRKYLTIYLKAYKKGLTEFVKAGEYKTMHQSELWKNLLDMINHIVWDYERECKEFGIPDIVISKMKQKNNESIQLTIDLISNISNSQFYRSENNLLKIYSILNIILSVLESTISNAENICDSINGQLKGLVIVESGKEYKEP